MNEVCIEIKNQMNRIRGQVNGIARMIEEGRNSTEIVQQITAVRSSLSRLGVELLKEESKTCFGEKDEREKAQKFEELVSNLFRATT